jgi:hypothetical protein
MIPAITVALCVPFVPIRIVLSSPATPTFPISMSLLPVVRFRPARYPIAMLLLPVVLPASALSPEAVLLLPVVLSKSASYPEAVL